MALGLLFDAEHLVVPTLGRQRQRDDVANLDCKRLGAERRAELAGAEVFAKQELLGDALAGLRTAYATEVERKGAGDIVGQRLALDRVAPIGELVQFVGIREAATDDVEALA